MTRLFSLGVVSVEAGGRAVHSILRKPKRLALLFYLGSGTAGAFHRREKLISLLWPEFAEERARAALRQSVYQLRRELPAGSVTTRGTEEVGLSASKVWCDAAACEQAFQKGRFAEVCELYRGDFLDGLHAHGLSSEFENWLSSRRSRLRRIASDSACGLVGVAVAASDAPLALRFAQYAVDLDPLDERMVRQQIQVLDRFGDRSAALAAFNQFRARLAAELEVEPSPETLDLVAAVRRKSVSSGPRLADDTAGPDRSGDKVPDPRAEPTIRAPDPAGK